ncbi:hypothetical protein D3C86_1704440 [compost metagenome]
MASLEKRPFSRLKIVKIILFVLFGTVTHYLPKLTKERAIKKELPVFPFTGSLCYETLSIMSAFVVDQESASLRNFFPG